MTLPWAIVIAAFLLGGFIKSAADSLADGLRQAGHGIKEKQQPKTQPGGSGKDE